MFHNLKTPYAIPVHHFLPSKTRYSLCLQHIFVYLHCECQDSEGSCLCDTINTQENVILEKGKPQIQYSIYCWRIRADKDSNWDYGYMGILGSAQAAYKPFTIWFQICPWELSSFFCSSFRGAVWGDILWGLSHRWSPHIWRLFKETRWRDGWASVLLSPL